MCAANELRFDSKNGIAYLTLALFFRRVRLKVFGKNLTHPYYIPLNCPAARCTYFWIFRVFFVFASSIRNSAGYGGIFMAKNREKTGLPDARF